MASEGERDPSEALVDDFGVHIGRAMGWPPMAGRAAGVLMLSEEPMTLEQLQEALGASKGSASEMTRLLITNGVVERFKKPGQRQFVYRWRDDAWVGCLQHVLASTTELLELAQRTRADRSHFTRDQRARLSDMQEYYRFMVDRLGAMLEDYDAQWAARQPR